MYRLATGFPGPAPSGALISTPMPDPAVAQNFIYTVPANILIHPVALSFTLTTDANAADRLPRLRIQIGAGIYDCCHPGQNHPANTARDYHYNTGPEEYRYQVGLEILFQNFPDWHQLGPGDVFMTFQTGTQVGDQIHDISFARRQFIIPG